MVKQPDAAFLFAHPAHFLALGFGAGLSRRAPGTVGTLVGFPVYWLLAQLPEVMFWPLLLLLFLLGVWACERAGVALGVHDHGSIVWDEIVAFSLVLAVTPATLPWALTAFLLFRLFDICKPFPIAYCDRNVKGGFGAMLDDVLAGAYAAGVIVLARYLI